MWNEHILLSVTCTTIVKIDERGRVVIPQPVRETLGIEGEETTLEVTVREIDE